MAMYGLDPARPAGPETKYPRSHSRSDFRSYTPPLLSFRRFSMSILLIVFWSRFGQVGPPLELPLIGFAKNIRFYLHKEFGAAAIRFYLHKEFRAGEIRFSLHKESLKKNREKSMLYVKNFPRCARQFVKNFLRKFMKKV